LTENTARTGEDDEIPASEEERFVAQLRDERQLAFEQVAHMIGRAERIAFARAGPRQIGEMLGWCLACGAQFIRIFVAQFVE